MYDAKSDSATAAKGQDIGPGCKMIITGIVQKPETTHVQPSPTETTKLK